MRKNWFITGLIVFLLTGCSEKLGPPTEIQQEFAVTPFAVPSILNVRKNRNYTIAYRVTHPGGDAEISSVMAEFRAGGTGAVILQLPLADDGGALTPGDGDVVARDGIYSGGVNSSQFRSVGQSVELTVRAKDRSGKESVAPPFILTLVSDSPPRLRQVSLPDSLPSGSPPLQLTALAEDSDGIGDIRAVILRGRKAGASFATFEDSLLLADSAAGLFSKQIDSSFAAGKFGDYSLQFQAVDRSGDSSNAIEKPFFIGNKAPRLDNPNLPPFFQRPGTGGSDTLHVKISAKDPQSLADIDSVFFRSRKPDGQFAGGGAKFLMFDDGDPAHGDAKADDGRFSLVIQITASSQTGDFVFLFQARDRVGNLSPVVADSVEIRP